jgi:sec-independent protein translocase protein TatA
MPFNLGLPEVIIVLVIALLFLGPKRLPEVGRSLGKGIHEFKEGVTGKDEDDKPAPPPPVAIEPPQVAQSAPAPAEQTTTRAEN